MPKKTVVVSNPIDEEFASLPDRRRVMEDFARREFITLEWAVFQPGDHVIWKGSGRHVDENPASATGQRIAKVMMSVGEVLRYRQYPYATEGGITEYVVGFWIDDKPVWVRAKESELQHV